MSVVLSQRTDVIGEMVQIPTDFVKIDKRNAQKEDVAGVDLYFQGTYYAVRLLE